jgi:hypothetical protein
LWQDVEYGKPVPNSADQAAAIVPMPPPRKSKALNAGKILPLLALFLGMSIRLYYLFTNGGPMGNAMLAVLVIVTLVVGGAAALAMRYSKSRK